MARSDKAEDIRRNVKRSCAQAQELAHDDPRLAGPALRLTLCLHLAVELAADMVECALAVESQFGPGGQGRTRHPGAP